MKSVLEQDFVDFEYLVIDGCSTDSTIEKVASFQDPRIKVYSEADDGIYDAMNKGLELSQGEYLCILNSDDLFSHKQVLKELYEHFCEGNEIVIGDISYFSGDCVNIVTRTWQVPDFTIDDLSRGWHPPHPAFFFRSNLYRNLGGFDTSLEISADFEIMLRYILSSNKFHLTHSVTTLMQDDGTSSKLRNILLGNYNVLVALRRHGINVNPILYLLRRFIPKLLNIFWYKFASKHF